jgi:alpha 1,2-mannosyltransferase
MMAPFRLRTLLSALLLVSFFWWIFARYEFMASLETQYTDGSMVDFERDAHIEFWRKFKPLLLQFKPDCEPPERLEAAGNIPYKPKDPEPRPELIGMTGKDVEKMRIAHEGFVDTIKTQPLKLHYTPGTKGLVSTAGGSYLPVLVISLRMLRRTGSKLPMEVFLADPEEYEEYICDVVLPSLNARCVILSEILESLPGGVKIEKYQFKPFAMIFSSFEEILFLDADAFPVDKPETLFHTEPFRSKRMVTWPDFWASSASPLYYQIASQEIPPMTVRQSTESGEIVVSKKTHGDVLLLVTYYNYWGPSHYYRLLSQGAPGEGDKETFVAAATVLDKPFYQVSEPICAIGHRTEGGLAGSAMVQFDPSEDFALTQKGEWRVNGSTAPAPRPFFVHANVPKFNPATVFTKQFVNPAYEDDGVTYTRAWTIPDTVIDALGDTEKHFWQEIMWTACELETRFRSWRAQKGVCQHVKDYWNAIFATPEDMAL